MADNSSSSSSSSSCSTDCTGTLAVVLPAFLRRDGIGTHGTCNCHGDGHKNPPDFDSDAMYFRATISSEADCTNCRLHVEITGPGIVGIETSSHATSGVDKEWGVGDWHNW